MASLADITRQRTGGMVWNTPQGAQSLPGYDFAGQQPAPPQPSIDPSQFIPAGGIPDGYAMMFQPQAQPGPRGGPPGLLDMLMIGSDVAPGSMGPPQGLLSMIGARPDMVGSNGPDRFAGEAPTPMPRPVKPDSIVIRKGDTLEAIAKRYGTTVKALAKKNGIKNANKIKAGATLKL